MDGQDFSSDHQSVAYIRSVGMHRYRQTTVHIHPRVSTDYFFIAFDPTDLTFSPSPQHKNLNLSRLSLPFQTFRRVVTGVLFRPYFPPSS
nr:hypothetical protein Iba_chr01cCG8760 [Ipomoea batatas]